MPLLVSLTRKPVIYLALELDPKLDRITMSPNAAVNSYFILIYRSGSFPRRIKKLR